MAIEVRKYELDMTDKPTELLLPFRHRILHVGSQDNTVCLWVQVVLRDAEVKRTVRMFGTGQQGIAEQDDYLGTAHLYDGKIVVHVYLLSERRDDHS